MVDVAKRVGVIAALCALVWLSVSLSCSDFKECQEHHSWGYCYRQVWGKR